MTIAQAAEKIEMEFKIRPHKRRVRCIDNGRVWESVAELANEYELNEKSVRSSIYRFGKYGNYKFEFID